jgi:hypothetical protein
MNSAPNEIKPELKKMVFNTDILKDPRAEDVAILWQQCRDKGYDISKADVESAWDLYSDSFKADWLIVGKDAEHAEVQVTGILQFCKEG